MSQATKVLHQNSTAANRTVPQAYRALFRASLRAVHYSKPARYTLNTILRSSFRTEPASSLSPHRVNNTLHFLRRAQDSNGLEHKILKNILISRYWRGDGGLWGNPGGTMKEKLKGSLMARKDQIGRELRRGRYADLDVTVGMLNESLGLCLRT